MPKKKASFFGWLTLPPKKGQRAPLGNWVLGGFLDLLPFHVKHAREQGLPCSCSEARGTNLWIRDSLCRCCRCRRGVDYCCSLQILVAAAAVAVVAADVAVVIVQAMMLLVVLVPQ